MANEKRLIGYDPILFGEFVQSLKNSLDVYDPYSDGYEDGIDRITDWLEFNFVDAVEVVHGRWLPQKLLGERVWDCSECKTLGSPQWKFCPVCGAKMDGDGNV